MAGSSPSVPRPGSASSCYLVESANTRVILDCGSGSLGSLQRYADPLQLDAVVVSHFHPDHVFDLVPLRYMCAFLPGRARPMDLYVHPGGSSSLRRLAAATATSDEAHFFDRAFVTREYAPGRQLSIGDLLFDFAQTVHYIEGYAVRVRFEGVCVAYSADTAPAESVVELARDADVFVCECALGARGADRRPRGHCNAVEAGRMASRAGVKFLLLTHYSAHPSPEEFRAAAAEVYGGPIAVAEEGWNRTLRSGAL